MNPWMHKIAMTSSGKSISLKIVIAKPYGNRKFCMSRLHGWRADLVSSHITFESNEWNNDVARRFVAMEALKSAKDKYEGSKFIAATKLLGSMEIHFWASKFLLDPSKSRKAWRVFYL